MRQFTRAERLGEQILRDISSSVDSEMRDKLPQMITFTHVRLSRDLRYATVYYSVLGAESARLSASRFFEQEGKHIRQILGSRLKLRHVPELTFKFDPSIEEGTKIERLLNEIKSDTNR